MEIKEILLVDARAPINAAIGSILQAQGYLILLAPDAKTATAELNNHPIDLLFAFLSGYEADKFDLLRHAKRKFPQTKVMVAGDPRKMAWQAFQEEVDDYLLTPFSPLDLCRRVNHCLNQSNNLKSKSIFKEKRGTINDLLLNSLKLKFCGINSALFSLIANINILIQAKHNILNESNLININRISDDLMSVMRIAKEFLDNQLSGIDLDHSYGEQSNDSRQIRLERIAAVGMP